MLSVVGGYQILRTGERGNRELLFQNPLLADSFSKYKTKVIPNKVCIIRLYTIKYCIFLVNRLIFSRNFTSMALTISTYYLN